MFKVSRLFSRRQATRSEPAGHLQESVDGAHDDPLSFSDTTIPAEGSEMSSSLGHAQRRRTSAPSDPPGNQVYRHEVRHGHLLHVKPRRARNWRLKTKRAKKGGSTPVGGIGALDDLSASTSYASTETEFEVGKRTGLIAPRSSPVAYSFLAHGNPIRKAAGVGDVRAENNN